MTNFSSSIAIMAIASSAFFSLNVSAEAPVLQTKAPFIYLSDNLDEKDKLGWCIDTVGRGFNEKLHAHSCKPAKGDTPSDVQFSYNGSTGQINSVAFANKCMDLNTQDNKSTPFGLVDCTSSESQQFIYYGSKGQFRLASDLSQCVAVSSSSKSAGPFMSRDLIVANCDTTEAIYTTWSMTTL